MIFAVCIIEAQVTDTLTVTFHVEHFFELKRLATATARKNYVRQIRLNAFPFGDSKRLLRPRYEVIGFVAHGTRT